YRAVFLLFRRVRLLVLDADPAPAAHRLEYPARWLDRRGPVCRGPSRNAYPRLELRSDARAPLAFCRSSIGRSPGTERLAHPSAFEHVALSRVFVRRHRDDFPSALVLGAAKFISFRLRG